MRPTAHHRHRLVIALATTLLAATCGVARASHLNPASPVPIPEDPGAGAVEQFVGTPAVPHRIRAKLPPRHPFMAPNGRSNIHNDAYQTDSYRQSGPLGRNMSRSSTFLAHECASITFDSRDRLVTICVGLEAPVLAVIDPGTLQVLAQMDLPPRTPGGGGIFTDFSGGGYFYLDNRDRAVFSTTTRHIWVVPVTGGSGLAVERDYDLTGAVPQGDGIISALPDWKGRIWFASKQGVVGFVDPASGVVRSIATREPIGNSFAVDRTGGVFMVTDRAMYRFDVGSGGEPKVSWRKGYANTGQIKPGQTQAGSGTTPTLMGRRWVAITDNGDPMAIDVFRRRRSSHRHRIRHRRICHIPVFSKGAGNTDQSLIGINRSLVVENNFGYAGPTATEGGATTTPGLERVRIKRTGHGCRRLWHSDEIAPSVVPKLSLAAGLVYTYTKPRRSDNEDAWYFTALDYRSGRTVYKRLAGVGLGFNNNYAPVTIGPDGAAYVGVLGGMVALRDGS
ncbi:MAG: hypothetical protein AABM29_04465 [Actinomycetota bacterium]